MPKYTTPQTHVSGETITSSKWNQYFGSRGNVQWAYDEYENVSAAHGVTLINSTTAPTTTIDTVHRFTGYSKTRGDSDFADKTTGVISVPVYLGYVWISATVEHQVTGTATTDVPTFYLVIIPISQTLTGVTAADTITIKQGFSTNKTQDTSYAPNGMWPIVKTATISTIVPIDDGFTKFQIGMYRSDLGIAGADNFRCTEFTVLPLGDVSGLVNVLELLTVVE
jgi:hypothetical protein